MKFANERAKEQYPNMNRIARKLAVEMDLYTVKEFGFQIVITETKTTLEQDQELKRTSDTHRTGRAFDVRTKDWTKEQIQKFKDYFLPKYNQQLGAVTASGPNLIFDKPHGTGPHFHVQIRRGIS